MAEQVEELATEVFGIQTALKRIGRKHLHFWLNAADAQFTTNGEGEQSLETWEPRLPSRFEQLGKQLLNFTPVTNSAFAAPGQGSEAFKGIKVTAKNECRSV